MMRAEIEERRAEIKRLCFAKEAEISQLMRQVRKLKSEDEELHAELEKRMGVPL